LNNVPPSNGDAIKINVPGHSLRKYGICLKKSED
jgi:hypothetical protein